MRLVAIIFCAALFVGLPTISHAQYNDNDQQNPKEYHDEDSQPLAIFADILYPLAMALNGSSRARRIGSPTTVRQRRLTGR